jgi:2-keto-3-deoxy-L-rhamnonate aldolase RhmA
MLVVAQVEDRTGIENIEAIVGASPGPHVVLIGRGDLATDLGRPGKAEDPLVVAATDRALAAVRASGGKCAGGIGVYSPGEVSRWRDQGCRFFFYSADTHMLLTAARGIAGEFKTALGR